MVYRNLRLQSKCLKAFFALSVSHKLYMFHSSNMFNVHFTWVVRIPLLRLPVTDELSNPQATVIGFCKPWSLLCLVIGNSEHSKTKRSSHTNQVDLAKMTLYRELRD